MRSHKLLLHSLEIANLGKTRQLPPIQMMASADFSCLVAFVDVKVSSGISIIQSHLQQYHLE